MLDKLTVEFTKSRPRHSNDNGLAETKNGAVIRKHLGYAPKEVLLGDAHIPQRHAAEVNVWCADNLNPYVNFHRPCLFAESITDAKGKTRKRYPLRLIMTPFEKLSGVPEVTEFLRPGITLESLRATASTLSDNEAAEQMNQARQRLLFPSTSDPKPPLELLPHKTHPKPGLRICGQFAGKNRQRTGTLAVDKSQKPRLIHRATLAHKLHRPPRF
ncbi:MAG: hypothetical protein HZT41_09885 [Dechloromonas sp.]|nr:MAG: hypothetical protein HZT41_09885 [Dechloromonas sp.]